MQREEGAMDLTKLSSPLLLSVVESTSLKSSTSTVQAVVSSPSVLVTSHAPTSSQTILASPQATHRTVICSTVDNSGQRDRSASPTGIDLSVSSRRPQEVNVTAILQPPTTTSRIEKVLRHYQAAAPMTLNGPDYLALYRRSSSGEEMKASGISVAPVSVANMALAAVGDTLDLRVARQPSVPSTSSQQQTQHQQNSSSGGGASSAAGGNSTGTTAPSISTITAGKVKDFDPLMAPPPFPIQQPPVLTPPDQSPSERSDTMLEGEMIACFNVGGERRLCCPQVLHIVLSEFGQHEINSTFEELQINVSTASAEQMEVLKRTGDIPPTAPSCGLITKTDAHRLTSALLGSKQDPSPLDFTDYHFVLVYHDCFGKCVGRYVPELYLSPDAKCIQCDECMRIFSPQSFVCHSHRDSRANRTVHWGFDPNHWRHYLLPIEDLSTLEKYHISKNALHSSKRCSQAQEYRAPIPVCQGGREALRKIIGGKGVPLELEAVYNSKEMENIRTILNEMKTRFTRITTPLDTIPISSGTSLLVSSKRKAPNDSYRDGAYTLDPVKRIKTEPEATKSPGLVSSLYPFLQTCLTTNTANSTVPGFPAASNTILANWLTANVPNKSTSTGSATGAESKLKSDGVSLLTQQPTASPLFPFGPTPTVSGTVSAQGAAFNSTTATATPSILDLLDSSHKSAPLKSEFPVTYDNLANALMSQKVKMPTAVPPTTSAMGLDPSNSFLANAWLDAKIPMSQQRYYQTLLEKSGSGWFGLDILKSPQTELIDLQTLQRLRPQAPPSQSDVPKVNEPSESEMFSSAYYKSVIEIRLLQLKQSMNDASHEAIERNIPMIDFLLSDTIKHLISQVSNPLRSPEQLAEPLKTKIYELILQFIDQLYPSIKTEPTREGSDKSAWKPDSEEETKLRVSPTVAVIKKSESTEEMIDVVSNPDEEKREFEERRSPKRTSPVILTHSELGIPAKSSPAPVASPKQSDVGNSHNPIPLSSASSSSSSASSLTPSPSPPESSTASVKLGFSLSNAISCLRGAAAVAHHHREHHPTSNTSMLLTTGSPN